MQQETDRNESDGDTCTATSVHKHRVAVIDLYVIKCIPRRLRLTTRQRGVGRRRLRGNVISKSSAAWTAQKKESLRRLVPRSCFEQSCLDRPRQLERS